MAFTSQLTEKDQKEYDQGIRETNQAITDIMTPARARSTRQENSIAEEKKAAQLLQLPDQLQIFFF